MVALAQHAQLFLILACELVLKLLERIFRGPLCRGTVLEKSRKSVRLMTTTTEAKSDRPSSGGQGGAQDLLPLVRWARLGDGVVIKAYIVLSCPPLR